MHRYGNHWSSWVLNRTKCFCTCYHASDIYMWVGGCVCIYFVMSFIAEKIHESYIKLSNAIWVNMQGFVGSFFAIEQCITNQIHSTTLYPRHPVRNCSGNAHQQLYSSSTDRLPSCCWFCVTVKLREPRGEGAGVWSYIALWYIFLSQ